jgi:hypothetical protein
MAELIAEARAEMAAASNKDKKKSPSKSNEKKKKPLENVNWLFKPDVPAEEQASLQVNRFKG